MNSVAANQLPKYRTKFIRISKLKLKWTNQIRGVLIWIPEVWNKNNGIIDSYRFEWYPADNWWCWAGLESKVNELFVKYSTFCRCTNLEKKKTQLNMGTIKSKKKLKIEMKRHWAIFSNKKIQKSHDSVCSRVLF